MQLDLSAIDGMDSIALGLLLIFRERGMANNKRVSLVANGGQIAQTLEQARFDALFTIL